MTKSQFTLFSLSSKLKFSPYHLFKLLNSYIFVFSCFKLFKLDAATAEAERVALLRAELVHMTQLKEIAETRAAALTLINTGNASRSFDNVHSLSVRTGDYTGHTGHTEDDVYSQQPMDFAQYKRFTASISNSNNNNPHSVTHPNNHPLASEMVSNGYTYPPLPTPPHRSYALDDFQGSDDSYAANLAGHRNGQRPARYVGMTRNIPNGTPKPYTESVTRYNGSEPVTVPSPRSRVDRNYLNGDVAASRGHGLSSSLCNGYASRVVQEDTHAHAHTQGGMEQRRGEGVGQGQGQGLKEMTMDRGCGRHSPTPSPPSSISRNHIEEALRMSDDESDNYFTVSARNEQNRVNERNALNGLNGVHERNGSNNDKIDDETKLSLSNTAKESIEEKSDTSSPVSDRSCSPVTRRKKMKIKSPWVNTFKASPNWNYSPPIQKYNNMGEAEEGQEELAGTPPKDTVDPAGKHSKEFRSIDDYFLQ